MPCLNHPNTHDGLIMCWRCRRDFCPNCTVELQHYNFCADCKTAQVRDLLAGTDMFSLDYAGMDRRLGAWLLDGMVKFGLAFGINQVGQFITMAALNTRSAAVSGWVIGLMLLFGILGDTAGMCYEGFMLAGNNGQTLGKMAVSIRVVTAEGNPITKKQAWWRSFLKLSIFYAGCTTPCIGPLIEFVFTLGQERASLHDLGAKTRVVNTD
jgi:uncharacterized RDD family membrane protein YckC